MDTETNDKGNMRRKAGSCNRSQKAKVVSISVDSETAMELHIERVNVKAEDKEERRKDGRGSFCPNRWRKNL